MANVEDIEGEGSVQVNGPPQFNDQPNFRTLREYLHPARQSTPSCIILPLNQQAFNLKPGMIQLLPTFHGMDSENPYIHIKEFEEDKAKLWLNSLRPRSIGTWREMQAEFLKKYFPTHRTAALQRQMMNFSCSPNDSFHQAWEKFKDLLNACPHHGFEMWRLVSFFYDSLTADFKKLVSTMCNGEFYDKEPSEAFDFFDQLAENTKQWETSLPLHVESRNTISHSSGKFQLKETDDLNARLASLARKVESLEIKKVHGMSEQQEESCVVCEGKGHRTTECPTIPAFKEVLYGQTFDSIPQTFQPPPQPFHAPTHNTYQPPHKRSIEDTLQQFMQTQGGINNQANKFQDQTNRTLDDIRSQLTKLTQSLSIQEKGKIPAQPMPNPRGQMHISESSPSEPSNHEQIQAITTLRSGKIIDKAIGFGIPKGIVEEKSRESEEGIKTQVTNESLSEKEGEINEKEKSEKGDDLIKNGGKEWGDEIVFWEYDIGDEYFQYL
ncbi:hypothetical protein OIU76_001132 [Salix suchowensis]|nr:hypothetical protein OIU76_001132 [Salix suchowensis]